MEQLKLFVIILLLFVQNSLFAQNHFFVYTNKTTITEYKSERTNDIRSPRNSSEVLSRTVTLAKYTYEINFTEKKIVIFLEDGTIFHTYKIVVQENEITNLGQERIYLRAVSDNNITHIYCISLDERYIKVIGSFADVEMDIEDIYIPQTHQGIEWSGTGFALSKNFIVTNNHVVEGAKSIKVYGINGNFETCYDANVIAVDRNNDLALIRIDDSRFIGFGTIPYRIKTSNSDVGEEVFVLGYPLTETMGKETKLTTGVISSSSGFLGDESLYQISAPIQSGNSGGPLFDSKGNVVGVVNAKHLGAENVGYAIKTSYLKNLIDMNSLGSILPTYNYISDLTLSDKVKKVKKYVFLIRCSVIK